ncbi:hypothetical protein AAG570_001502 [Ranatra chinensis]|uniref:Uncharacterized protein n=1 Tax=Ranatra chinensis TaxID=642074 RepID=A0ABD0Y9J3_9HEMI
MNGGSTERVLVGLEEWGAAFTRRTSASGTRAAVAPPRLQSGVPVLQPPPVSSGVPAMASRVQVRRCSSPVVGCPPDSPVGGGSKSSSTCSSDNGGGPSSHEYDDKDNNWTIEDFDIIKTIVPLMIQTWPGRFKGGPRDEKGKTTTVHIPPIDVFGRSGFVSTRFEQPPVSCLIGAITREISRSARREVRGVKLQQNRAVEQIRQPTQHSAMLHCVQSESTTERFIKVFGPVVCFVTVNGVIPKLWKVVGLYAGVSNIVLTPTSGCCCILQNNLFQISHLTDTE